MTRRRVIASNVTAPTNFVAECVITATTSCPRFCSPRTTSTALYAPIPPVTPSVINATALLDWPITRLPDYPIIRLSNYSITRLLDCSGFRLTRLDLLDLLRDDLALGDGRLLVLADIDARHGSGEELTRAGAGRDDELEGIGKFCPVNHFKQPSSRRTF